MVSRRAFLQSSAASVASLACGVSARADNAPGVTESEIKIGQTMPYSGPLSTYAVIGKTDAAYFAMINESGGVNGRKIRLISLDDEYDPAKTFEQTRRLVEHEGVAFIFNSLGTWTNGAIRPYLNINEIPQLFVASGAEMFGEQERFPWTMGWQPSYQTEAAIFGKHVLATKPNAEIGVLLPKRQVRHRLYGRAERGTRSQECPNDCRNGQYEYWDPTIDPESASRGASCLGPLLHLRKTFREPDRRFRGAKVLFLRLECA